MVAFGSGRGLSVFATAGIVGLFRGLQKSENEALGQKMLFPGGQQLKSQRSSLLGSIHTIVLAAGFFATLAFAFNPQVLWINHLPSI